MHGYSSWCADHTVYPKKYAHGFCFAVLCCGYTLTDFPISIRLTSLALWQSNDCPSAIKATLVNMDKHFMWIHYERLHNHNKAKHNKTVCVFLGIYCSINFYWVFSDTEYLVSCICLKFIVSIISRKPITTTTIDHSGGFGQISKYFLWVILENSFVKKIKVSVKTIFLSHNPNIGV